ncbi:hypothetical protein EVA_07634 [gut metagenome]|uniref:Uncharacterized protein n=1 Tax=gut metagenome TaxID=749906 RepID=J9GAE1_9ZZZZ
MPVFQFDCCCCQSPPANFLFILQAKAVAIAYIVHSNFHPCPLPLQLTSQGLTRLLRFSGRCPSGSISHSEALFLLCILPFHDIPGDDRNHCLPLEE